MSHNRDGRCNISLLLYYYLYKQLSSLFPLLLQLRRELQDQYLEEKCSSLATQLNAFRQELKGKMERLGHVESMYSSLIVKECQYKQELIDAREESIKVRLHAPFSLFSPSILLCCVVAFWKWSGKINIICKSYLYSEIIEARVEMVWPLYCSAT